MCLWYFTVHPKIFPSLKQHGSLCDLVSYLQIHTQSGKVTWNILDFREQLTNARGSCAFLSISSNINRNPWNS